MEKASREEYTVPYSINNCTLLRNRELGLKPKLGDGEILSRRIYSNLNCYESTSRSKLGTSHGGIFNLEFSLDGRLLVAACEEKSVLLFDAANQNQIKNINDAHNSCVNCVRFLDSNVFATCSDDTTIKLWDTRKLQSSMRTLQGHLNWVKNIEYIEKDQIMVTSAFDGSIYTWDLKSPTENNLLYNNVFLMTGLMRTKLTPDGSKMILCTTSGYMIIIHDLNLETLSNDLRLFRPNLYRLMQLSEQSFPAATVFNHLFSKNRKTNRLEFIDDFPNDAEVIASLQIHPMGWCALSRNMNEEEKEEWTAVHDIQARDRVDYENYQSEDCPTEDAVILDVGVSSRLAILHRPTDIWMGYISNENLRLYRASQQNTPDNIHTTMGIINSGLIGRNAFARHFSENPEEKDRVVVNLPRLTHFAKEKAAGKGYIKELCFSSDGLVICSPYDKGVRLLGFNDRVQDLCYCVPDNPKQLHTLVEMNNYHPEVVLTCKFNPRHYELVSGCLGGKLVWYKPIF